MSWRCPHAQTRKSSFPLFRSRGPFCSIPRLRPSSHRERSSLVSIFSAKNEAGLKITRILDIPSTMNHHPSQCLFVHSPWCQLKANRQKERTWLLPQGGANSLKCYFLHILNGKAQTLKIILKDMN